MVMVVFDMRLLIKGERLRAVTTQNRTLGGGRHQGEWGEQVKFPLGLKTLSMALVSLNMSGLDAGTTAHGPLQLRCVVPVEPASPTIQKKLSAAFPCLPTLHFVQV